MLYILHVIYTKLVYGNTGYSVAYTAKPKKSMAKHGKTGPVGLVQGVLVLAE